MISSQSPVSGCPGPGRSRSHTARRPRRRGLNGTAAALQEAGVRVAIGVGGSLDYHAGFVRRAPEWAQVLGLEWLFRLIAEPWRLRRQFVLPQFAVLALAEAIRGRIGHR